MFSQKLKKIFLFLSIPFLLLLIFVVFWQIKPKNSLSLYDFRQPEKYNQAFLLSVSDYIFSIRPLDARAAEMIKDGNVIKYLDVYQNTDVVQTKSSSRIKEEIILKKPGHPLEFKYQINIEQYDLRFDTDGNLIFFAKGKAEDELSKIFTIPAPFLIDDKGNKTYEAVKMQMNEEGVLTFFIDKNWLDKANYPVTLDPTVEINIINVHSSPQQGDNWTVNFTTQGQADLKIIPNDQATIDDDEFVSLSCLPSEASAKEGDGQNLQPQILQGDVIYYPNWQCSGTGQIVHYTKKAGRHTLRFEFGDQTVYAYNSPGITIVQKAPDSGTPTTGGRVTSVSFGTLPSAGNLIVAVIIGTNEYGMDSEEGPQYVRDNKAVGVNYTEAISSTAGYSRAFIYYRDNIGASSGTFTVTVTGYSDYTSWDVGLLEVSGYDPDNPLGDTDYNIGIAPSATPSAGPVSVVGNALYVAATGREGTSGYTSVTSTAGWTEQWEDITGDPTMNAETLISSGSQTATWTTDPSAQWHGVIAAFNEEPEPEVRYTYINSSFETPYTPPATQFFTSNWEGSGILDSGKWTGEDGVPPGQLSVVDTEYMDGTHSLKYTGANIDVVYYTMSDKNTLGMRFAIKGGSITTGNYAAVIRDNIGFGNMVYVTISSQIQVWYYTGVITEIGTGFNITTDTWYQVEVLFTRATSIKWKVWDATGTNLVKAEQSTTTSVPNAPANLLWVGAGSATGGSNTYYFDVFAADSTGYPGPYTTESEPTHFMYVNAPASAAPDKSGLVAYWTFDGANTNWTSATGGTTADKSGNGNTGTMTNMSRSTSPVAGVSGQGLKFDGVNDIVRDSAVNLSGTNAASVSLWMYELTNFSQDSVFFEDSNTIGSNIGFIFSIYTNCGPSYFDISLYNGSGWNEKCYNFPLVKAAWHHYVTIFDTSQSSANEIKFYINGILQTPASQPETGESSNNWANTSFNIGMRYTGSVNPANAIIDEVRVYNRALSASEVQELYRSGARKLEFQVE